jgi:hypothetical protein
MPKQWIVRAEVYTYGELSEKAQKAAIEQWQHKEVESPVLLMQTEHELVEAFEWLGFQPRTREVLYKDGSKAYLNNFKHSVLDWSHHFYFWWDGPYQFAPDAEKSIMAVLGETHTWRKSLLAFAERLRGVQAKYGYQLHVTKPDHAKMLPYYFDVERRDRGDLFETNVVNELRDIFIDISKWAITALQQDAKSLTDKEVAIVYFQEYGYHFFEDGGFAFDSEDGVKRELVDYQP